MLCRLSFLWKQRALVVFEDFLLATLKDITRKLGVSNSSTCCSDPVPPSCPPCRWGKFTAALLLKLRSGVVRKKKKKALSEINVAAQRAFTTALWSIYIENTIKLSQGGEKKATCAFSLVTKKPGHINSLPFLLCPPVAPNRKKRQGAWCYIH